MEEARSVKRTSHKDITVVGVYKIKTHFQSQVVRRFCSGVHDVLDESFDGSILFEGFHKQIVQMMLERRDDQFVHYSFQNGVQIEKLGRFELQKLVKNEKCAKLGRPRYHKYK